MERVKFQSVIHFSRLQYRKNVPLLRSLRRSIALETIFLLTLVLVGRPFICAANDPPVVDANEAKIDDVLPEADKLFFAQTFETAAKEGDVKLLNSLIDWELVLDTASTGDDVPAINQARKNFKIGFLKSINNGSKSGMVAQITETVKQGGTFKFLRLGEIGNEPFALFRIKLPNQGGANYHQFFLKRSPDGLVRAQDIYVFLTAERITETIRRVWLPLSNELSKTFLEKLFKPVDPFLVAFQSFDKIQKFVAAEQYEQALAVYKQLPEPAKKQKIFQLLRLRSAMNISEAEYSAAIESYREFFPTDAALDFLSIDGYRLRKELEKAIECIDRTNSNLGGDAWMVSLRGIVLADLGRLEEAREATDKAIQMEPDFEDAYWNAIAVSMLAKNYDDTAKYLSGVEEKVGKPLGDLTQVPFYAEFVKSPQYTKWMESRQ